MGYRNPLSRWSWAACPTETALPTFRPKRSTPKAPRAPFAPRVPSRLAAALVPVRWLDPFGARRSLFAPRAPLPFAVQSAIRNRKSPAACLSRGVIPTERSERRDLAVRCKVVIPSGAEACPPVAGISPRIRLPFVLLSAFYFLCCPSYSALRTRHSALPVSPPAVRAGGGSRR